MALAAGGLAGAAEAFATMPFEVTKMRMQQHLSSTSMVGSMADTARRAGLGGFYFGLKAQVLQVAGKTSIRFASFEQYKRVLSRVLNTRPGETAFLAGTLAGLTEAVLWVAPTERLKVLRQAELSTLPLGGLAGKGVTAAAQQHASLGQSVALVLRQEGIRGLFAGVGPTAARNAIANGVRFAIFDSTLAMVSRGREPATWHSAAAGGLTGAASTVLTNPTDVLKTRMQDVPVGAGAGQAGALGTLRLMIRDEGIGVLARGLGPRLIKISLGQAVIFSAYNSIRGMFDPMAA